MAGALLPRGEGVDEQRRRAGDEEPHVRRRLAREAALGQHAHVERGHAHEDRGARHRGDRRLGIELVEPDHGAAVDERAMHADEQAMRVIDGQRVDEYVTALLGRSPAPVVPEHQRVREQVAVREHCALAAPRGAAGVEDAGQVVPGAPGGRVHITAVRGALQQAAVPVLPQREDMARARLEGDLGDPAEIAGRADDDGGLGIADEVLDLGLLVGGIERQKDETGTQRRQVQQQGFNGLFDLYRNAAAFGKPE